MNLTRAPCGCLYWRVSTTPADRLRAAFDDESSSARLQTALAAGTRPDARLVETLIDRCAIEPDFYVRDMLTWALVRHPAAYTVPLLLQEVASGGAQARTQALHTLSKIGEPRGWEAISPELLRTTDDELARSAWRAAVILAPETARAELATDLAALLGRGTRTRRLSLSRALVSLGEVALPALTAARESPDEAVREHAIATGLMMDDADAGFDEAMFEARKVVALGGSGEASGWD